MKKLLLLVLLLCTVTATTSHAQVTKRVLIEEITSSTCGPCALSDPWMEAFEEEYADKVCILKWHVNWPSPGNDPFYTAYNASVARSRQYYANDYAPFFFLNGLNGWSLTSGMNQQSFVDKMKQSVDDAAANTSPYSISFKQEITADSVIVTVTAKAEGSSLPAATDLQLMVVLAERIAIYKGTNGRPYHTHAVRTALPGLTSTGAPMINAENPALTLTTGQSVTRRYAIKINPVWNINQLMAVAFIQSVSSKEIYQSAWNIPNVSIKAKQTTPYLVGLGLTYDVEATNHDNQPVDLLISLDKMTSPGEWGLTLDQGSVLSLGANASKTFTVSAATGVDAVGIAQFSIYAKTSDNIGAGGIVATSIGGNTRDIIVNASYNGNTGAYTLTPAKIGQIERAISAYGYKPVTVNYSDFYDYFGTDWSRFRTIFYMADQFLGLFNYTFYTDAAKTFMDAGGNLLLSSSSLVGAYYDASNTQGNPIFISKMEENFNLEPSESVDATGWSQLKGASNDNMTKGINATMTGMSSTQRLTIFDPTIGWPIFRNENDDVIGVKSEIGFGKLVFLSFGFDKIATKDSSMRYSAISNILDWFAGVVSVKKSDDANEFMLSNYPNPANTMSIVTYALTERLPVRLSVYDVMGREIIRSVNDQIQDKGTYEAEINVSKLSPGTYTLSLSAGGKSISKILNIVR